MQYIFRFPRKYPEVYDKWLEICELSKEEEFSSYPDLVICDPFFPPEAFQSKGKRKKLGKQVLKWNAVPNIPTKQEKKKISKSVDEVPNLQPIELSPAHENQSTQICRVCMKPLIKQRKFPVTSLNTFKHNNKSVAAMLYDLTKIKVSEIYPEKLLKLLKFFLTG